MGDVDQARLAKLIADVTSSGGSELSNHQLFVERLTGALGLPQPEFAREATRLNDYVFERGVTFRHPNGTTSAGRIDCYKRGCFVLEAKQSSKREAALATAQLELAGLETANKAGHAKRGTRGWDKVMSAARAQAEDYARALPVDHGYPPFLLIVDVGHVIEVHADFSGLGKNYEQFPDRQGYRIGMDDLLLPEMQARLRAIWTDPQSLNPLRKSAEVTQDIAQRLARIARRLEKRHHPKDVAEFLMRCLFTMFVEDAGPADPARRLIPDKGFERLLRQTIDTPHLFAPALESLWRTMDSGGYDGFLGKVVKRFNGSLFRSAIALPLEPDDIIELHAAARRDWRDVEPAIFGTLLERALDARERSSFGAHYTPRPYVERLVIPTIMEPLNADWQTVKALVVDLNGRGRAADAVAAVRAFHHKLCTTRVLDPACGTGNFLYVALEKMKRLEGQVLVLLEELGEDQARLLLDGETVSPRQFFGLELNERAVPIAELVLWIGFLKWQLLTFDVADIPEPILNAYGTIRRQDALIAYDERVLATDERGLPLTVWDGRTTKPHPITGEEVPDEAARIETYRYVRPRRAPWPPAEFIVGNPPFIGGKDMRRELGDGYAEACWRVRPEVPGAADFVMHFWDEAARLLSSPLPLAGGGKPAPLPFTGGVGGGPVRALSADGREPPSPSPSRKREGSRDNPLRRFGFITTNSITQTFSRRVVERWLGAKEPLSLVYAVPDHPWLKAADKAAVRIAMTVAAPGGAGGVLATVVREAGLNSDAPVVELAEREGKVTPDLSVGPDISALATLLSADSICHMGVKLHGAGFIVDGDSPRLASSPVAKPFVNGRDLAQRSRNSYVLDLFGLSQTDVRDQFPEIYQHLLSRVKPERDENRREIYRRLWWVWGEPRTEWRSAVSGLSSYIATTRTAKHRVFQRLSSDVVVESKVVGIASDSNALLACLSSRLHVIFANATGGWLGVGNDATYNHSVCFNSFPIELSHSDQLAELGERLDAFRRERLAAHDFLTMTGLYNALERVRELEAGVGAPLSAAERDVYDAGRIAILRELHDEIDRAVLAAYGWADLGERLVGRPGATTPSPYKTPDQDAAEEELLGRLVALNAARAAEERAGLVRWLRPDFQRPRLSHKVKGGAQVEADLGVAATEAAAAWPTDGLDQIGAVRRAIADAGAPIALPALAAAFRGRNTPKRRERVEQVVRTLVEAGGARRDGATGGYYLPR